MALALALVGWPAGLDAQAASAASYGPPTRSASAGKVVRGDERTWLVKRLARSYFPGRVGDISVIPREGDILTSPARSERHMHGSPWDYDARIPLILYGSRHFRPGIYDEEASHQDIGATLWRLLELRLPPTASGRPLEAAMVPEEERTPPRLVALVVLDAMHPELVDRYGDRLPTLTRLREEGAWFGEARVDYLPTATSVAHVTMMTATGAWAHGVPGNTLYDRTRGASAQALGGASPRNIVLPTVVDIWSHETGGEAIVAAQGGTDYTAAALAGHGACFFNGRPALAAYYDSGRGHLTTNPECYGFPAYLEGREIAPILEETGGVWMGHDVTSPSEFRRSALFSRFEGETARAILAGEPFGADSVTDLFFANLKASDYVSHQYGPDSPEMAETLAEADRQLGRIVSLLEEKAGRDGFALVVTADHGMPPEPSGDRARHTYQELRELVNARFDPGGPGIFLFLRGADYQLYLDRDRLRGLEVAVDEVAAFVESLPWIAAAIPEREVREVWAAREFAR